MAAARWTGFLALVATCLAAQAAAQSDMGASGADTPAAPCDSAVGAPRRGECLRALALTRLDQMETSLAALGRAEADASAGSGADLRPRIAAAQAEWRAWMARECQLEGDLARETAGGVIQPACEVRLIQERMQALDRMTWADGGLPAHLQAPQ